MGYPNTDIEVMGPASDDTGWLNAGATVTVHGNAANGTANAMAQGKIFVEGNIGARGMTMTKQNPRFDPPELWVLGSAGDYFGEFMAGGIAVICGFEAQNSENVLGYRPFVGMVGGKAYFRGPHKGFSDIDAMLAPISDPEWQWLEQNLKLFLERIGRIELFDEMADPTGWQMLRARTPQERTGRVKRPMRSFHMQVWDAELGRDGLIGDLTDLDRSPIPVITTGELRRFVPVWENRKYLAPCEASCPTGVPVHERWRLIREGRVDEAVDLALSYTPFPATICGYLCPNPCMSACTRQSAFMAPVDITELGKASIAARLPELPDASGSSDPDNDTPLLYYWTQSGGTAVRDPPVRRRKLSSSSPATRSGVKVRRRAAASSKASGTPSSLRQISAIAASWPSIRKSGLAWRARSTSSSPASLALGSDVSSGSVIDRSPSAASPGIPNSSRLVATTLVSGADVSISATVEAVASIRCSQLSTTSSTSLPDRCSIRAFRGSKSDCGMASASRNATSTPSGSETGPSGTSHVPSGYFGAASAAACSARRVFPTPPTPVIVTSLDDSRSSSTPETSVSRPTNDVSCTGRLLAASFSVRSGGKASARPGTLS